MALIANWFNSQLGHASFHLWRLIPQYVWTEYLCVSVSVVCPVLSSEHGHLLLHMVHWNFFHYRTLICKSLATLEINRKINKQKHNFHYEHRRKNNVHLLKIVEDSFKKDNTQYSRYLSLTEDFINQENMFKYALWKQLSSCFGTFHFQHDFPFCYVLCYFHSVDLRNFTSYFTISFKGNTFSTKIMTKFVRK